MKSVEWKEGQIRLDLLIYYVRKNYSVKRMYRDLTKTAK